MSLDSVRCNRLPYRFGTGEKKWPVIHGFRNINVCSSGQGVWKQLSPMKLGPILFDEHYPDGSVVEKTATNLENLWQSAKVWPGEEDEKTGYPTPEWYTRRDKICHDVKGHRHIKKEAPLYSWWQGQRLNYDEARRTIYIPLYMKLVQKTLAWQKLKTMVDSGEKVQILGYDGRDYEDLEAELEDLTKPFGHELVLCGMLTNMNHLFIPHNSPDHN